MKRFVWTITLLLLFIASSSATPSPGSLQEPTKSSTSSKPEEKNATVNTVTCDWASGSAIDSIKLAEDNGVKLALYEAVVSGKGAVKAKKDCATIEGDPAPIYAITTGGKIKITHDYSRDRHMAFKGLIKFFVGNSYTTRKLEIGYLDDGQFIPLKGTVPQGRRLFLRLKGKEYF